MIEEKNPAVVELGSSGGLKGGKVCTAQMTPEDRSESPRKAARARGERSASRTHRNVPGFFDLLKHFLVAVLIVTVFDVVLLGLLMSTLPAWASCCN